MTRKDYILIADAIKNEYEANQQAVGEFCSQEVADEVNYRLYQLVYNLGTKLHAQNPRFLFRRFEEACGVPENWDTR